MWLDDLRPLQFGAPAEGERLSEGAYQAFGIAGPRDFATPDIDSAF